MFEDELSAIPVEPPRSVSVLPGLRLRSVFSKGMLTLPLIFVGFFALLLPAIFFEDPHARLSFGRTETTAGEVLQVTRGTCPSDTAGISYKFTPPGGPEFRSHQSVGTESPYFKVSPTDPIPVQFLVSDPSINVIAGTADPVPYFFLLVFPVGAFLSLRSLSRSSAA